MTWTDTTSRRMRRVGSVRIILIEKCLTVSVPAFFALHEIDGCAIALLAGEAKNQFRAAFADRFASLIDINEPGPAAYDFSRLPFRKAPLDRRRTVERR